MDRYLASAFFDLEGFAHAEVFAAGAPVWEALGPALDRYLASLGEPAPPPEGFPGAHFLGGPVLLGPGCIIEPGAVIRGPLVAGPECEIRTGAYLRGGVVLGRGCIVGAHSEVKRAILLDGARAPHQNYVGDSILGRDVNLGAGTILSNVKNIGHEISFPDREGVVHTGLRKLGAILGDGCRTGCNTVLNPGVVMGPGCVTYPNSSLRSGYYPPRTLVKVRQQQLIGTVHIGTV